MRLKDIATTVFSLPSASGKKSAFAQKFRRKAERQYQKLRNVEDRFLTAAGDGDLATLHEILQLFPEAVSWKRGNRCDGPALQNALDANRYNGGSNLPVLQLLLDHGADPDNRCRYNWTALHHAIRRTDKEAIALLIRHGADPEARDHEGLTCHELAGQLAGKEIKVWLGPVLKVLEDMRPVIKAALQKRETYWQTGTDRRIKVFRPARLKTGNHRS
mgnify:CR=1 FL=1